MLNLFKNRKFGNFGAGQYKAELTLSSRLLSKQLLARLINVYSFYALRLATGF